LGRKSNLTGRTEVWKEVIPMCPDPIGGAGFETFWLGRRADTVRRFFGSQINEAHDGYIEVYLNLGLVGVGLIALILAQGYRAAARAFRRDLAFGGLLTAYVVALIFYNITEAGFRMLDLPWFFLLLSSFVANRVSRGREAVSDSTEEPLEACLIGGAWNRADEDLCWTGR
jgi:exopolysaccharide production protein ExoQ